MAQIINVFLGVVARVAVVNSGDHNLPLLTATAAVRNTQLANVASKKN